MGYKIDSEALAKIQADMADSRVALTEEADAFYERLKGLGVDDDTAFLVRQRLRLEKSKAEADAAKKFASDIESYTMPSGEFPIGDLLELMTRRASGLYAAVLALSEQIGRDDFMYQGTAQLAIDLYDYAKRVNEGYHASLQVKNGKSAGII